MEGSRGEGRDPGATPQLVLDLVEDVPRDDGEDAGWQESANLATRLYLDELDETLADELRERLNALERAEQRLASGTYGLSIESGSAISDERLEALPTAERTAEEEAWAEHGRGNPGSS